ncbi:hypothetical protein BOV93_13445, partial [Solemya velum gill symbiont]
MGVGCRTRISHTHESDRGGNRGLGGHKGFCHCRCLRLYLSQRRCAFVDDSLPNLKCWFSTGAAGYGSNECVVSIKCSAHGCRHG